MPNFIGTSYRRRTEFTPADLSPVLWLEADAVNTLFTTIAGSTTPADTGTVGRWEDRSANGFHLTATADDTTRPTWNLNSNVPYVNFDGTDDILRRAAALGMYAAGASSIFAAIRANPAANRTLAGDGNSAANNDIYCLQSNTADGTAISGFIRNNAGTAIVTNVTVLQAAAYNNTDRVSGVVDSGSDLAPYLDGVAGTPLGYTRSGTLTSDRFGLGGLMRAAASSFIATRVYALVIVNRPITTGERRNLERYLARKMGLFI